MAKQKQKSKEKETKNYLVLAKSFLEEVAAEAKKIVWPSRESLIQSSLTVLGAMVILTMFMAIADFIWTEVISLISV